MQQGKEFVLGSIGYGELLEIFESQNDGMKVLWKQSVSRRGKKGEFATVSAR